MSRIMTVLGPIPAGELGVTMAHEHVLVDLSAYFTPPPTPDGGWLAHGPITLENLGWVRQNWMSSYANLRLDEEAVAVAELKRYASSGGGAIIDATVIGIGRDQEALRRISLATGVHIVMGTGFYVDLLHPSFVASASESELAAIMKAELTTGVTGSDVRAGYVGEVGTSYPITSSEIKVLRSAAMVASDTGCAVAVHPGRHPSVPAQLMEIFDEAGLPMDRLVLAHMERTIRDIDALADIAAAGCTISFDVFGQETSMFPAIRSPNADGSYSVVHPSGLDMPSDAQRLDLVCGLVDRGWTDRIVVAQDVCTKHRLATYGGHGYDHVLNVIRPWMIRRGISAADVHRILVSNPARIFVSS